MGQSGSKLILASKLADGLDGASKADVNTTRCLGVFKEGPVQ